MDPRDVEAEVEVLAEPLSATRSLEVLVGGRDDAHVDGDAARAAQPLAPPCLDARAGSSPAPTGSCRRSRRGTPCRRRPAEAGLRSAVVRAGERAALVAEQLALEQALGDGGAVDADERPRRPPAVPMNQRGHQLLAGARFPGDEDVAIGGGDLRRYCFTSRIARLAPTSVSSGNGEATTVQGGHAAQGSGKRIHGDYVSPNRRAGTISISAAKRSCPSSSSRSRRRTAAQRSLGASVTTGANTACRRRQTLQERWEFAREPVDTPTSAASGNDCADARRPCASRRHGAYFTRGVHVNVEPETGTDRRRARRWLRRTLQVGKRVEFVLESASSIATARAGAGHAHHREPGLSGRPSEVIGDALDAYERSSATYADSDATHDGGPRRDAP